MILILAGTTEGRQLMERLHIEGIPFLGTVTSQYGKGLVEDFGGHVRCCQLDETEMTSLLHNEDIKMVIDCTHPYAVEISKLAIAVCCKTGVTYVRYERPSVRGGFTEEESIRWVEDYQEAGKLAQQVISQSGNVLSTIGSRRLDQLVKHVSVDKLIVRVLPDSKSIEECEKVKISRKNIIAIQGPFTEAMNEVIYKEYNVKAIIMKESGEAGGTKEKIRSALVEGVTPIVIQRPRLEYPRVYHDRDSVYQEIMEVMK